MAFNAQQEINNRKILEDLQIKKQLLQKGVGPSVTTIPGIPTINSGLSMPSYMQTNTAQQPDFAFNSSSRTAWTQANNQSFGFFIPQDSVFGNNILPVLPRFDATSQPK